MTEKIENRGDGQRKGIFGGAFSRKGRSKSPRPAPKGSVSMSPSKVSPMTLNHSPTNGTMPLKKHQSEHSPTSSPRSLGKKRIGRRNGSRKMGGDDGESTKSSPLMSSSPRGQERARRRFELDDLHTPDLENDRGHGSGELEDSVRKSGKKKNRRSRSLGALEKKKKNRSPRSGRRIVEDGPGVQGLLTHLNGSGTPLSPTPSRKGKVRAHDVLSPLSRTSKKTRSRSKGRDDASESGKISRSSKSSKKSLVEKHRKKRGGRKMSDDEDSDSGCPADLPRRRDDKKKKRTRSLGPAIKEIEISRSARDDVTSLPKFHSPGRSSRYNESFRSDTSELSGKLIDITSPGRKGASAEKEIVHLHKTIANLKEDQLKSSFASQTATAQVRRELREEKLELQRSQTERRELRAEMRDKDVTIDEFDRKVEALEKVVESQLDKVDELEEELKNSNEENFRLEDRLGHMEKMMEESGAAAASGSLKEKALEDKRVSRQMRRLDEREQELEDRERQLQTEREQILKQSGSSSEVADLQEDNRMLLKALNQEKADAAEARKEQELAISKFEKELKEAKMRSYSQVIPAGKKEGDGITKLLNEKDAMRKEFEVEKQTAAATLEKKDETIAFLEMEVKRLKGGNQSGDIAGSGDNHDNFKKDLDAMKAESQVLKNKFEGAQRRNQILEDDIDHWKSVNCNLEDELVEWKSQAANWRVKYENMVDIDLDREDPDPSILPFSLSRGMSRASGPAAVPALPSSQSMHGGENPGHAMKGLWSKLTTPTSGKKSLTSTGLSTAELEETLARSTFH